ncbi:50S ribosomal protein L11 methyltransferase [Xylella fastidiosa]|nr:50S ribosomal protein L11 methyltransferase [Xylella fastidiosa]
MLGVGGDRWNNGRFKGDVVMAFLEVSVQCQERSQARYEEVLESFGALAVTLLDADADTVRERGVFEPGVGKRCCGMLWC